MLDFIEGSHRNFNRSRIEIKPLSTSVNDRNLITEYDSIMFFNRNTTKIEGVERKRRRDLINARIFLIYINSYEFHILLYFC